MTGTMLVIIAPRTSTLSSEIKRVALGYIHSTECFKAVRTMKQPDNLYFCHIEIGAN